MIIETIVTSRAPDGHTHIAPMGIRRRADFLLLAPFRPSQSLDNILRERSAVINYTDDVRVFAGCLTSRWDWPLSPAEHVNGSRLEQALAHTEVRLERIEEDELRPTLVCRAVHQQMHAPFPGFNRAQAAVIEAAVLVSRLHILPWEKVETEIDYLRIAIDKTAGARERQAWEWLMEAISAYRQRQRRTLHA